jgi:hypothetical protein
MRLCLSVVNLGLVLAFHLHHRLDPYSLACAVDHPHLTFVLASEGPASFYDKLRVRIPCHHLPSARQMVHDCFSCRRDECFPARPLPN